MKAVSGKTWVQKAVFLEPKPLFSSAFTMCSRGWYLCMELRMIWAWGEEEDISWEWRGARCCAAPSPQTGRGKERDQQTLPKKFFPPQKLLLFSPNPQHGYYLCWGHLSPEKQPPHSQKSPSGAFFSCPLHSPQAAPLCGYRTSWVLTCCPPCSPGLCCCVSPPETLIHVYMFPGGCSYPHSPHLNSTGISAPLLSNPTRYGERSGGGGGSDLVLPPNPTTPRG